MGKYLSTDDVFCYHSLFVILAFIFDYLYWWFYYFLVFVLQLTAIEKGKNILGNFCGVTEPPTTTTTTEWTGLSTILEQCLLLSESRSVSRERHFSSPLQLFGSHLAGRARLGTDLVRCASALELSSSLRRPSPQAITPFGGVGFIAWHLRCPK